MKIFRGICLVVAILATGLAIEFIALIPTLVQELLSTNVSDGNIYGSIAIGVAAGAIVVQFLIYSFFSSVIACVASIAPAFSHNSFIKFVSRAIIVIHVVGWLAFFLISLFT